MKIHHASSTAGPNRGPSPLIQSISTAQAARGPTGPWQQFGRRLRSLLPIGAPVLKLGYGELQHREVVPSRGRILSVSVSANNQAQLVTGLITPHLCRDLHAERPTFTELKPPGRSLFKYGAINPAGTQIVLGADNEIIVATTDEKILATFRVRGVPKILSYSPTGARLAVFVAGDLRTSDLGDGTVGLGLAPSFLQLYDVEDAPRMIAQMPCGSGIRALSWSMDGRQLILAGYGIRGSDVAIFNADKVFGSPGIISVQDCYGELAGASISSGGDRLVTLDGKFLMLFGRTERGSEVHYELLDRRQVSPGEVSWESSPRSKSVSFTDDDSHVVCGFGHGDGKTFLEFYRVRNGSKLEKFCDIFVPKTLNAMTMSPDRTKVITGHEHGEVVMLG